jgi:hypothetical protein
LHNKIPEPRFSPKTSDTKRFPLITVFHDFNPATVSSHHTTLTFEYILIETEGAGGGVWRIRRRSNTAPEDVLLVYILEGEEEEERGLRAWRVV